SQQREGSRSKSASMYRDIGRGSVSNLVAAVVARIADIGAADWDACFPGDVEGHAYYVACETAGPTDIRMAAAVVWEGRRIIAVAPLFRVTYRLDISLQGPWRAVGDWVGRNMQRFVSYPLLGFGSPYAERCHIGLRPGLKHHLQQAAAHALFEVVETHAREQAIGLVAVKDLAPREESIISSALRARGHTRPSSLPLAVLD